MFLYKDYSFFFFFVVVVLSPITSHLYNLFSLQIKKFFFCGLLLKFIEYKFKSLVKKFGLFQLFIN